MTAIETVWPRLGKRNRAGRTRHRYDGVAGERLAVEQGEIAQVDATILIDSADLEDDLMLQHGHAVLRQQLGDFLRFPERIGMDDGRLSLGQVRRGRVPTAGRLSFRAAAGDSGGGQMSIP